MGLLREPKAVGELARYTLTANLRQLIDDAQDVMTTLLPLHRQAIKEAVQYLPVVDARDDARDAKRTHHLKANAETLRICTYRGLSHDIHITLQELSETPLARLLCAPHRRDLIPPERHLEVAMLRNDSREGHGQIIAERDVSTTVILKAVEQLVALISILSKQDLRVLKRRRRQGRKPKRLEDLGDLSENLLPWDVRHRQVITKPLQYSGLYSRHRPTPSNPRGRMVTSELDSSKPVQAGVGRLKLWYHLLMNLPKRLALAHLPTPIHPLAALSRQLDADIWVKRDDLTGSHLSGNKIRKLEFLLAEASEQQATHIITCGGVQSNHCRASALAAASLGMKPELLLRTPSGLASDLPTPSAGNVLLGRLAGATIHPCTPDTYRESRNEHMMAMAEALRATGARPYIVPEGGSNALGALGYVECAKELVEQLGRETHCSVWVPVGSGGTLAGLALGFKTLGVPYRAVGVPVCDDAETFREIVQRIAAEASQSFGLAELNPEDYDLVEGYQGRGYALTTPRELALIRDTLVREGIVLDHVYTGKAFGAFVEGAKGASRHVFVHTGGIFGLSAAASQLDELLSGKEDAHP